MLIGTYTTIGVKQISLQHVPQYLVFEREAPVAVNELPLNFLASIKVTVLGKPTHVDLDGSSVEQLSGLAGKGSVNPITINAFVNGTFGSARRQRYIVAVADGLIGGHNTEIQFELQNEVSHGVSVYSMNFENGSVLIQNIRNKAFAKSSLVIEKFSAIALPSMTDSDILNIEFSNGVMQTMYPAELRSWLSMWSGTSTDYGQEKMVIGNYNQAIKRVTLIANADQFVAIQKFMI